MVVIPNMRALIDLAEGRTVSGPRQTLTEATSAIVATPEFKAWFKGSKVVDARRKPLVCYHGTPEAGALVPHGFSHFGSYSAANFRIGELADMSDDPDGDTPHIYPVFLSIKKPLRFEDLGENWYTEDAYRMMVEMNGVSQDAVDRAEEDDVDWYELAPQLGFDGVTYQNGHEDQGHVSWYTFNQSQAWNIFAKQPY